ncbi:MAG: Holliday junction resolvase RuvX [Chitinophagaceae bacterium]|nr:Holliday junction resolvase RuvX [Chitinophagaceae bacterium]MCW5927650.1 Holliday junction resolvase RuvX [Chitinophagaceae bacterium]
MPRILAIDYGLKRTGIAVTDPLQIIASGLTTIESSQLISFLKDYFLKEEVERIVIGEPKNLDDSDTHASEPVRKIIQKLNREFPAIPVTPVDERYTSRMAKQAMLDMGMKKKQRRNKANIDQIAATIILQEYLQSAGGGR